MLRLIKYLVILAILLVLALPVIVLVTGAEETALVPVPEDQGAAGMIEWPAGVLGRITPAAMEPGEARIVTLSEAELATLVQVSAAQLAPAGAAVDAHPGGARVRLTWALPNNPLGGYLNLAFDVAQISRGIALDRVRLGGLDVPAGLANWLLERAGALMRRNAAYTRFIESVNGFRFTETALQILYQPAASASPFADLVPPAERERLRAHAERIARVSRDPYMGRSVSLVLFLEPVFANARDRTATRGEPAEENRAALLAMMFYLSGVDVPRLLGVPARADDRFEPHGLTLLGREDLARQFVMAAGTTAAAGSPLLEALGLFDDVEPEAAGEGVSLAALAADRAGERLAQAAQGPEAEQVQAVMSASLWETDFMPQVKDLPMVTAAADGASGADTHAFDDAVREIDARIADLKVYQ